MRVRQLLVFGFVSVLLVAGCAPSYRVVATNQPPQHHGRVEAPPSKPKYTRSLPVPPGHLPRPGYCRVWLPDTPPGRQPKPVKCSQLRGPIPAGAWVLHRPSAESEFLDVTVYDAVRVGVVLEVRVYAVESGELVRLRAAR